MVKIYIILYIIDIAIELKGKILLEVITMFDIREQLTILPDKPGVYIMKDKDDNIIYVGKAISLKNRVRQYFQSQKKSDA